MKGKFKKRGRRGATGGRFFLTAVLVAIAIFVIVKLVQRYWAPGGTPEVAKTRAAVTATSAMPNPGASLAGFSLVLIRCRNTEGCPYYDLHVKARSLAYSGVRGVARRGNLKVPLSRTRKIELLELVRKARFFSLDNSYVLTDPACRAKRTDAPTLTIGVTLNGVTKIVRANRACANVPARLVVLAEGIDQVTRSAQWTGASAPTTSTTSTGP